MMVPKGQNLCTQCYTHGWLYYILDGLAKVYISTSDGNEQIIDFYEAGHFDRDGLYRR